VAEEVLQVDETRSLDDLLAEYHVACARLAWPADQRAAGEADVRSFYHLLQQNRARQTQLRLEKTLGSAPDTLRLVTASAPPRRGWRGLLERLFG